MKSLILQLCDRLKTRYHEALHHLKQLERYDRALSLTERAGHLAHTSNQATLKARSPRPARSSSKGGGHQIPGMLQPGKLPALIVAHLKKGPTSSAALAKALHRKRQHVSVALGSGVLKNMVTRARHNGSMLYGLKK